MEGSDFQVHRFLTKTGELTATSHKFDNDMYVFNPEPGTFELWTWVVVPPAVKKAGSTVKNSSSFLEVTHKREFYSL